MKKSAMDIIAMVLLIIGGLNWGLVGVGVGNVVELALGTGLVTSIIYILVGLSALYAIYLMLKK